MLPTGEQIAIAHGNQRAVITEVGASLRNFVAGGINVIEGYAAEDLADGARGQVMFPWPNRLSSDDWTFSNRVGTPQVDNVTNRTLNHGLVRERPFRIDAVNQNRCSLSLVLHPSRTYPFASELKVDYHLGTLGLTCTMTVTNIDSVPLPFGAGSHPYLAVTTPSIEGTMLHIPAKATVDVNERLLPTGTTSPVIGTSADFLTPKSVTGVALNTTYTDLLRDDHGMATFTVTDAEGRIVEIAMDRNFPYACVYTGESLEPGRRRSAIAIEPMTCAADAFHTGKDIIVLEPGQHWAGSWRLRRL
jgi:aldose 1-epimerase